MKTNAEIIKYLGYDEESIPPGVRRLIVSCRDELRAAGSLRVYAAVFPGNASRKLVTNAPVCRERLSGCGMVVFCAATFGEEVDALLVRWSKQDMGRYVVLNATAGAMVKAALEARAVEEAQKLGITTGVMLEPGTDGIERQVREDILRVLGGERETGISLGEGYAFSPVKSGTAIIPLSMVRD
ncbi:MAG: hypothetical protein VB111_01220 [Clostridiaceae bacterium]|nr:hypothetical protein [Clostridiaceae bacterium]